PRARAQQSTPPALAAAVVQASTGSLLFERKLDTDFGGDHKYRWCRRCHCTTAAQRRTRLNRRGPTALTPEKVVEACESLQPRTLDDMLVTPRALRIPRGSRQRMWLPS